MDKGSKAAKMIRRAKEQSAREVKEEKRRSQATAKGQEFCAADYALRTPTGKCPRCDFGRAVYERFCRNCLTVHANTETGCKPWRPED